MQYIDVLWKHQDLEDPIRLVSELGDDGSESRKLEFFSDGTVDAAGHDLETSRTRLGTGACPRRTKSTKTRNSKLQLSQRNGWRRCGCNIPALRNND
jgi:hypothetical protein